MLGRIMLASGVSLERIGQMNRPMNRPKRFALLEQLEGCATLGDYKAGRKVNIPPGLSKSFLNDPKTLQEDTLRFLQDNGWSYPPLGDLRTIQFHESFEGETRIAVSPDQTIVHMRRGMKLHNVCRASPLRVYLGVYNGCNCECSYCCASATKNRKGYLTVEEVDRISRHLYDLGVIEVRLGESGEPTQHPDFPKIVETIKRNGLYLSLNTNGVMTNELREFIATSGYVDLLIQSLDGLGEAHDGNRGKGSYAEALKTIEAVYRHVKVRFNFVVNNETQKSLEDLAKLAYKYNAEIYTVPMRPAGRATKDFDSYLMGLSWENIIVRMERLRHQYPGLILYSTYDVLTLRGDYLVDHKGSCAAGVEGCCVSPAVEGTHGKPARIRMFGCSFLVDTQEDVRGKTHYPFLSRLFNSVDEFCKDFFDVWQEKFDIFREPTYRDDSCMKCILLKENRCTGRCAAIGYYRTHHPSFDPTIYCASKVSKTSDTLAIHS